MRLKGKVALITGSTRGIGRNTAERFLQEGAEVVIASRNKALIDETLDAFKEYGDNVYGIKVDVTNAESVKSMFDETINVFGTIDILVNNAGITSDAQLHKMTEEQWDEVISVNLKGVFNCSKQVALLMRDKGYGKIINISSVVGLYGNFGQLNYAATKSGIIGMTKTMAKELGRKNINVNAVCPGFIMTDMTAKMPKDILTMMKDKSPLKRLGNPIDVANACLFLASDEANFITGAVLSVDGGVVL